MARRQLLALGFTSREIDRRLAAGRLMRLHRGVYAVGHRHLSWRAHYLAAALACSPGAVLSHRSAAAVWGLLRPHRPPVEVSARSGHTRGGILVREVLLDPVDMTVWDGIPVTGLARTLFDLAEVVDLQRLGRCFEEADRLGLLEMGALEDVCARGRGRRARRPIRQLIEEARDPVRARTDLEERFALFCRERELPANETNVDVLGHEVDALWPRERLIVELDGYSFHRHRAAFESDRAKDAARQTAGYRTLRVTHRRLEREPAALAAQIRALLRSDSSGQRGQGTVEWVGLVAVVALTLAALVGVGVRVPGTDLARAVASRILCAASLADGCGDEPTLIATYGDEVGRLVRRHMPTLFFEHGARALPIDFRRCRATACGDGTPRGLVHATDAGMHVTAFVHVVDCRGGGDGAEAWIDRGAPRATGGGSPNCSGDRAGNLYIQYWLYYADSATLRGVPIAGNLGYHHDDWESVTVRIGGDGRVDERASSHDGYNATRSVANDPSDAGIEPLKDAAELLGARPHNGWGTETHMLLVSGGSHAGNTDGYLNIDRVTPGRRVHLVPLEPIAAAEGRSYRFAVTPPWRKRVWRDPEAEGTD